MARLPSVHCQATLVKYHFGDKITLSVLAIEVTWQERLGGVGFNSYPKHDRGSRDCQSLNGDHLLIITQNEEDFCRLRKNKADCHFNYEGIEVNVEVLVKEDLGNLDPLSVTFNFNFPYMNLSSPLHTFILCDDEEVVPIQGLAISGSHVVFRIGIETHNSQSLDNRKTIYMFGYLEGKMGEKRYQFLRTSYVPNRDIGPCPKPPPSTPGGISDLHSKISLLSGLQMNLERCQMDLDSRMESIVIMAGMGYHAMRFPCDEWWIQE
ncbi:unnamed protein product [Darwinula stevensoni]|uniref:Uncharacterized protein n=1 Tax=Darwinula stevensoni TaxID=69355 RepID=A0A7R9AC51_9CRUS|nr:unnamed protein product [Darwinula stevensoni]CAG0900063.1 unnamed protein product [Darwinula stevensoni]